MPATSDEQAYLKSVPQFCEKGGAVPMMELVRRLSGFRETGIGEEPFRCKGVTRQHVKQIPLPALGRAEATGLIVGDRGIINQISTKCENR